MMMMMQGAMTTMMDGMVLPSCDHTEEGGPHARRRRSEQERV